MPKAKVYARFDAGEIAWANYCVEGLHVRLIRRGAGSAPERTVTKCDQSCSGKSVEEIDFPDAALAELRALLPALEE